MVRIQVQLNKLERGKGLDKRKEESSFVTFLLMQSYLNKALRIIEAGGARDNTFA